MTIWDRSYVAKYLFLQNFVESLWMGFGGGLQIFLQMEIWIADFLQVFCRLQKQLFMNFLPKYINIYIYIYIYIFFFIFIYKGQGMPASGPGGVSQSY